MGQYSVLVNPPDASIAYSLTKAKLDCSAPARQRTSRKRHALAKTNIHDVLVAKGSTTCGVLPDLATVVGRRATAITREALPRICRRPYMAGRPNKAPGVRR
ncbi:hypothetical protein GGTG_03501 [Gaeumannomyces tritici R3-111a-1]|uniref:Uncharacterized protein n=1 Tax=Gaeumannomyces tritici (strain R3-111a-1) TaxID=644352 RepID=J3NQE4_GAET3|nr:hypothetical protein GGTG_03501 [Gaeumannomyces tritici R3-111a-1]EJT78400.1 hypothetical protein GGTG_03501 [Gaeumannomyces tritici R3-111a-1]